MFLPPRSRETPRWQRAAVGVVAEQHQGIEERGSGDFLVLAPGPPARELREGILTTIRRKSFGVDVAELAAARSGRVSLLESVLDPRL